MKTVIQQLLARFQRWRSTPAECVHAYLCEAFEVDHVASQWIDEYLDTEAGRTHPIRHLQLRTEAAKRLYRELIGGEPHQLSDLLPLVLRDSLRLPTTQLTRQPEARRTLRRSLHRGLADFPPSQPILFDHVSKTGGSTIGAALNYLFPLHTVSNRLDLLTKLDPKEVAWDEWARWPIICGHIGRRHYDAIPDIQRRQLCTVIRDPVSRTRSVYTWHRFNVRPTNPSYDKPGLRAARELNFSDYIRCEAVQQRFCNVQFQVLSNEDQVPTGDAGLDRAHELLANFELVGVTDQMTEFFDSLLRLMDVTTSIPTDDLLRLVYRNKSLGSIEVTDEDAAHIRAINPLDTQLYQLAQQRVEQRVTSTSARAA